VRNWFLKPLLFTNATCNCYVEGINTGELIKSIRERELATATTATKVRVECS
jgi:hypothetical protein